MTKEDFIRIKETHTLDVMPLLHYYHNLCNQHRHPSITMDEFKTKYNEWLEIPLFNMAQSAMIHTCIIQLQKHFNYETK